MILKGKIGNLVTGEGLVGAKVEIHDRTTAITTTVTSGANGVYNTSDIDLYDKTLDIIVSNEGFVGKKRVIKIPDKPYLTEYLYDINLRPCCVSNVSNVNGRITE